MNRVKKTWSLVLRGYLGACTTALFFGLMVLLLRLFGKLKIEGEKKLLMTAKKGRMVIMSNHPSLVEGGLLPVILSPRHLLDLSLFFWSMPDRKLFSSRSGLLTGLKQILSKLGRCIPISRSEGRNYQPVRQLRLILSSGENVVLHPEAGRTMKGTSFVHLKTRRLRKIESSAVKLVARLGGTIVPVFVEKREELASVSSSLASLFMGKQAPMVVYVGDPYEPDSDHSADELNRELEQKILEAGLS